MTKPEQPPVPMQILQMATSKMLSKPLYVAAKLQIADLLSGGPLTTEELARKTETHSPSLYRILRALASVGVFEEIEGKKFRLTPLAECLQDRPESPLGMVLFFGDPVHDQAWENLLYSVHTGKPGFDKAHGKPVFEYFKENREIAEVFNKAMTANAVNIHSAVVEAYDFKGIKTLYDVGGGHGHMMKLILEKHPSTKGGIFDLPDVVAGAETAYADSPLKDRCVFLGGSFFEKIPQGADAHILGFVIHDWSDEECEKILKNCKAALPKEGKLLLLENVIEEGNEPSFGKLLDLEMLVMTTGRERTAEEYAGLLTRSGFKLNRVMPTKGPASLVEATAI